VRRMEEERDFNFNYSYQLSFSPTVQVTVEAANRYLKKIKQVVSLINKINYQTRVYEGSPS